MVQFRGLRKGTEKQSGHVEHDRNVIQDLPSSCGIKCQQLIMRDYGYDVSEYDLRTIAEDNGWFDTDNGVCMNDNGKLLGCFGIEYHHSQFNDLESLEQELSLGHRVMVSVNQYKLKGDYITDKHNEASHAIIVTNICLKDGFVKVTDPASGDVNRKYDIVDFTEAWKDSHQYMLATDNPAIFEYNPFTGTMISV